MNVRLPLSALLTAALFANALAAQEATTPAAPVDPRKTEADIATAQATARKAAAEASKAEQDLYGSLVTAAGARGAATVNAGAGAIEATAVATQALSDIAMQLRPQAMLAYGGTVAASADADLPAYCDKKGRGAGKGIVVVTDEWRPDTGLIDILDPTLTERSTAADDLKIHVGLVILALQKRIDAAAAKPAAAVGSPAGGLSPLVAAGASALLGAVKTDLDLYGVTLAAGDAILLRTVAGDLKTANPSLPVYVPAVATPTRGPARQLARRFAALDAKLSVLARLQTDLGALTNSVNARAAAAGDKSPLAATYLEIVKDIALLRAPLDAFVVTQQSWLAAMTDASKGRPIALIAAEQAEIGCIQADGGLLVRVKADAFGGSIVTRKNLWTTFGGTPIFVSAGGVVTFSFTDLRTGEFINSGVASSMGDWSPIIRTGPRGSVAKVNFRPVQAP